MRHSAINLSLILVGLGAVNAKAASIEWGDQIFVADLNSNGSFVDSSYKFELGTFGSFVPTEQNLLDWRLNWKLLDSANYNDTTKFFSETATLEHNSSDDTWSASPGDVPGGTARFAENEQVYIWIYNNLNQDETTEWGVYTRMNSTDPAAPNWVLPAGPTAQTTPPLFMFISDVNTTPFGGANGSRGPGEYTDPSGLYGLQTHTFLPVPEPTGTFFLGVVGALGLMRRRRKA